MHHRKKTTEQGETTLTKEVESLVYEHASLCTCIEVSADNAVGAVDPELLPLNAAFSVADNLWDIGSTITFSFLNGSPVQHAKVEQCFHNWLSAANLKVNKVPTAGDVRITFAPTTSWSLVGKKSQLVAITSATMQLSGIHPNSTTLSPGEARKILHECGHMLGLEHEHQSPASTTVFTRNHAATYQYYRGRLHRSLVARNVLQLVGEVDLSVYSPFDCMSIMLYDIPACTTNEGHGYPKPMNLSALDRAYMIMMYPPSPSTGVDAIKGAMSTINIPADKQSELLQETCPSTFRECFMEWVVEARVNP
ncbi:hypothetical protein QCA50_010781 [Cerrena zonata]|uniref:Peptidase M12A domain-containing protein n=1 Tax=Cerrena zonata TaxID=2478898 RepID=A0AAW0FYE6_9APHY